MLGFPFGFRVANPEPLDGKYGPYATTAAAKAAVLAGERYIGLTVNVAGVEYWWKDATADGDLVIKSMGGGWNTTGETILTGDVTISGNFSKYFTGTGNFAIGHNVATAKFQVRGNGTTLGELLRAEDSAGSARFILQDNGIAAFTSTLISAGGSANGAFRFINDTGIDSAGREIISIVKRWSGAGVPDSNNGGVIAFYGPNQAATPVEKLAISMRWQVTGGTGAENSTIFFSGLRNGASSTYMRIGNGSLSLGENAQVLGTGDTAVGVLAKTLNNSGTSFGYQTADTTGTYGIYAISIGYQANQGTHNIAARSIAIGRAVKTTGADAIAMGSLVTNSTAESFAIGWNSATPHILFARTADMYINNTAGNFMLGGSAPLAKLHVRGNGTTSGALTRLEDSAGTQRFLISDAGNLVLGTGALTSTNTLLDMQSTTQGIAMPRMTAAQRDAIASPYDGLMVYNTTAKTPNWHDGVKWNDVKNRTVVTQNINGAVSIDLALGDLFILTLTANVTSFTFTNEIVGKDYIFIFKQDTTYKTLTWTAGKFEFSYGNAPTLTNPTINAPANSKDIFTAVCNEAGFLAIVQSPNFLKN